MKKWIKQISNMGAFKEVLVWAESYDSLDSAWLKCERGDWMLWLAGKLVGEPESSSRKTLVLAACQCARLALPYVKKGEERPLKAIETAEAWAKGEDGITLKQVRAAAAFDAATYAAYAAAYAADAAYAAYAATYAATYAAYAATYAATYAAAYAAADARISTLKQCADIVRQFYPQAPKKVLF